MSAPGEVTPLLAAVRQGDGSPMEWLMRTSEGGRPDRGPPLSSPKKDQDFKALLKTQGPCPDPADSTRA